MLDKLIVELKHALDALESKNTVDNFIVVQYLLQVIEQSAHDLIVEYVE